MPILGVTIQNAEHRLGGLLEGASAVAVQQRDDRPRRGRDGSRLDAALGNARRREVFARRQPWRGPHTANDLHHVPLRVVNDDRHFAPQAVAPRLRHRLHQQRRRRRIRRIAASLQRLKPRCRCLAFAGSHRAVLAGGVPVRSSWLSNTKARQTNRERGRKRGWKPIHDKQAPLKSSLDFNRPRLKSILPIGTAGSKVRAEEPQTWQQIPCSKFSFRAKWAYQLHWLARYLGSFDPTYKMWRNG